MNSFLSQYRECWESDKYMVNLTQDIKINFRKLYPSKSFLVGKIKSIPAYIVTRGNRNPTKKRINNHAWIYCSEGGLIYNECVSNNPETLEDYLNSSKGIEKLICLFQVSLLDTKHSIILMRSIEAKYIKYVYRNTNFYVWVNKIPTLFYSPNSLEYKIDTISILQNLEFFKKIPDIPENKCDRKRIFRNIPSPIERQILSLSKDQIPDEYWDIPCLDDSIKKYILNKRRINFENESDDNLMENPEHLRLHIRNNPDQIEYFLKRSLNYPDSFLIFIEENIPINEDLVIELTRKINLDIETFFLFIRMIFSTDIYISKDTINRIVKRSLGRETEMKKFLISKGIIF